MPFKLGTTDITAMKLGTTDVVKLAVGSTIVWPAAPTVAPTGVAATLTGDDEVTLTWTAPVGEMVPITDYAIQRASLTEFADDFNRADGTLGSPWTTRSAGGFSALNIVSGQVRASSAGAGCVADRGNVSHANHYIEATIHRTNQDAFTGLLVRGEGATPRAEVGFEINDAGAYDLAEFIPGHTTRAISADGAAPINEDIRIRGEVEGSTARYYVNGLLILTGTLTSRLTGTRVGCGTTDQAGSITTRIDDFVAGVLAVPASPTWTTVSDTVSTATTAVLGSHPDGRYVYRVAAVGAGGTGPYSGASNIIEVGQPELSVPDAPTGLDATAGSGQVALTWTAPVEDGGAIITDYVVQYRTTVGPGSWTTFSEATSATTNALVTGLTNDTSYDFQVAAVNLLGTGPYSATDTATPTSGAGAVVSIIGTPTLTIPGTTSGSFTANVTVSAGSNRAMFVFFCIDTSGPGPYTFTVTSDVDGSLTQIAVLPPSGNNQGVVAFVKLNPTTGAHVLTCDTNFTGLRALGAICFAEVNQTTPYAGVQTHAATATSASLTVPSVTAVDMVLDCIDINQAPTVTVGANQTAQAGTPITGASQHMIGMSTQAGTDGGVMSWSWSSSQRSGAIAFAVKAA